VGPWDRGRENSGSATGEWGAPHAGTPQRDSSRGSPSPSQAHAVQPDADSPHRIQPRPSPPAGTTDNIVCVVAAVRRTQGPACAQPVAAAAPGGCLNIGGSSQARTGMSAPYTGGSDSAFSDCQNFFSTATKSSKSRSAVAAVARAGGGEERQGRGHKDSLGHGRAPTTHHHTHRHAMTSTTTPHPMMR
jgi:hypothetical protein